MIKMTPEQIESEIQKELQHFHLLTKLKHLLIEVKELRREITELEGKTVKQEGKLKYGKA